MASKRCIAIGLAVMAVCTGAARGELRLEMSGVQFTETAAQLDLKYTGQLISRSAPSQLPDEPFNSAIWHKGESSSGSITSLARPAGAMQFWSFVLGVSVDDFDRDNNLIYDGVEELRLELIGSHVEGPHQDPPDVDQPLNALPEIATESTSRPAGANIKRKRSGATNHPTSSGRAHKDKYSVRYEFEVGATVNAPLAPPLGERNIHLHAKHLLPGKTARAETGMTTDADTLFGFNASNGELFLSPEHFTTARRAPNSLPATDPEFAADPFLGSFMGISPVTYIGMNADGLHEFTRGELVLLPAFATYEFSASFDAMLFDPAADVLFAILDEVDWSDDPDDIGFSPFLDQFTDQHLFSPNIEGIQLRVPVDLDGLTNNFTSDAFGQAILRLTGALIIPEPATLALVSLAAVLVLLSRSRRSGSRISA